METTHAVHTFPSTLNAMVFTEEAERLTALRNYHVLDTGPEPEFDELALLAARICETPISLISLVDLDRQWFKARYGIALSETSRTGSFCAHVIDKSSGPLVVPDATLDFRFARHPLVINAPGIRFYAGVPLFAPGGHAIGTLCVIDLKPRTLTAEQQETLLVLGRQVMAQLELRRSLNDATPQLRAFGKFPTARCSRRLGEGFGPQRQLYSGGV